MFQEGEQVPSGNNWIALTSTSNIKERNDQWFIDIRATKHIAFQRNVINDYKKYKEPSKIYVCYLTELMKHMGKEISRLNVMMVLIETVTSNLHKVLFVPKIKKNLLSVQAMTQMQAEVTF